MDVILCLNNEIMIQNQKKIEVTNATMKDEVNFIYN